ncbi:MAG: hypothetical protein ABW149_07155 [Sedimenticola sp.]
MDLGHLRRTYVHNAMETVPEGVELGEEDVAFLAIETRSDKEQVQEMIDEGDGAS